MTLPYVEVPELVLLPAGALGAGLPGVNISIKPFGALVALGVVVGAQLAAREGRRRGLHESRLSSFIFWVVGAGFVGGHVFDTLFYFPERVVRDPLSLLRLWEGLSSFGGFVGALLGLLAWRWRYRCGALPYADVVASAFPVAWLFGRAGCSIAHDHPGLRSSLFLAVDYPGGARLDLGLCEFVLTVPLAVTFLLLRRRPRPWGFYAGTMSVVYAPLRFALDFLRASDVRIADARYAGLTPAQWASVALFVAGVTVLYRALDASEAQPERSLRYARR